MLGWARGKTKKDHIKNEDILREANIKPMAHKLHTTEMRMLRWARGKTKEGTARMKTYGEMPTFTNDSLPRTKTFAMSWPIVKEGRGGYHHEEANHASARKEKKW